MTLAAHRVEIVPSLSLRHLDGNPWINCNWVQQIAGNTTRFAHGMPAPTVTGTVTIMEDATGQYIDHTNASNGNGGWTSNANYQPQTSPTFSAVIETAASLANMRHWIGLSAGDPRTSDNPSTHLAAFRFSSAASDTYWMCCTKDGTTLNANSSGVAVATSTRYELTVDLSEYNSGLIHFLINGTRVYTSNANLPGSTQSLDPYASNRAIGSAVAQHIYVSCYQVIV